MNKTAKKILAKIVPGCTNECMIAADLRLSVQTVRRYVKQFLQSGMVERGYDGSELVLTDAERERMQWEKNADRLFNQGKNRF